MSSALPDVLRRYPGIVLAVSRDGIIEDSNGRLETLLGGGEPGRRLADLLEPGSTARWNDMAAGGGEAAAFIELSHKGDGDARHAFTAIPRADDAGWWLVEHPEEARAQVQTALAQRDEVLGVVAHDLRNPLNVISMASKQLRMQVGAPPDERLLDILDRVVRNMDRLIGDLVEVRRIDAGKLRLDLSWFEVPELVQQVWEEMAPLAERRKIRLDRSCAALPALRADRGRLMQVLFNLIDNAIRVTRDGEAVSLAAAEAEEGVQFTVADAGPGIPAEELPHLFDRFWQGSGGGSAGLALAMVKGIVEAHGGRVEVESTPGQGSRFRLRIPSTRA